MSDRCHLHKLHNEMFAKPLRAAVDDAVTVTVRATVTVATAAAVVVAVILMLTQKQKQKADVTKGDAKYA